MSSLHMAKTVPFAVSIRVGWVLWQKQAASNSQCDYTLEIRFRSSRRGAVVNAFEIAAL